ncbi:MAG TPA: hypothetical protein VGN00_19055 [Puia sp.]
MKKNVLTLICLFSFFVHYGQTKVSWGDEFKLRKGSTDLTVIKADATGVYLEESHLIRSAGFWRPNERKSSILVKLNSSMGELFRKDYDHDLKGKDLENFIFIADKLYLFASSLDKKAKTLNLYAAELDKGSGDIKSDWKEISNWDLSEKGSDVQFKISPNSDTSKIVLTSTNTGKSENRYEILTLNATLHPAGKSFSISNEFDPKTFQVEDFVYTPSGNAVLVGRIYEYEEGKKKKDKNLIFKNYNIRVYDNHGQMIKELVTDIDGKFLVNGKMIQLKNQIVLAAFYSNEKKKKEINGLLVERIDPVTGNIISSTKKELNNSLLSEVEDEDSKGSKKNDNDDAEGFSSNLVFRNFYATPDNGLVILSEKYSMRINRSTSTINTGMGTTSTSNSVMEVYESQDIYISKISANGNIDWLDVLPKSQYEEVQVGSSLYSGSPLFMLTTYFTGGTNRPFFSGFGCLPENNTLNIFFNDDERNADVVSAGKKIKKVTRFSRTDCFQVRLDLLTGKLTRKILFSNRDIPPAMPRLGVVFDKTLYVTGKEEAGWGKSKVAVGKISS